MAGRYDITIEQGATYSKTITLKDASGVPIDISGYLPRGQIRRTHRSDEVDAHFTFDTTQMNVGKIIIQVSALITEALTAGESESDIRGKYVYDIELVFKDYVSYIYYATSSAVTLWSAATPPYKTGLVCVGTIDYLYLGNSIPFNELLWDLKGGVKNIMPSTLLGQYWNGSSWENLPDFADLTKDANGCPFAALTGFITFTRPSDWVVYSYQAHSEYWIRLRSVGTSFTSTAHSGALGLARPTDIVNRLLQGQVYVSPEVTR